MTFKHVKFEDSVVMRSLEKLAKEKGLVKQEPITKTASQKVTPSANLTENVLNLCSGLRERGFHKAASDLESKYMALKHAQTLYETSSEKGEDLIDAAHPKGSHKLEDVDGEEALFETILDQHLKNMKVVEKDPTGKLASSKDILGAVKVVLAQEGPKFSEQQVTQWYTSQTMAKIEAGLATARQGHAICYNAMKAGYVEQDRTIGSDLSDIGENIQKATNAMYTMRSGGGKADPTVEGVNAMIEGINGAIGRLDAFSYEAPSQAMKNEAQAKFTRAIQILEEAKATIRSYQSQTDGHTTLPIGVIPPQAPASTLKSTYKATLKNLKARYDTFIVREDWTKVPKGNQQKLVDWLGATKEQINKWNNYLDDPQHTEDDLKSVKTELDAGVAEIKRRLDVYQNGVVNKAPQQNAPGGPPAPGGTTNNPNAVAQK